MIDEKYLIKLFAYGGEHEVIKYEYDTEVDDDEINVIEDLRDNFSVDVSTDEAGLKSLQKAISKELDENIMYSLIGYYDTNTDKNIQGKTEIIFEDNDVEVVKRIRKLIEKDNLNDTDLNELENRGIPIEFIDYLTILGIYELKFKE